MNLNEEKKIMFLNGVLNLCQLWSGLNQMKNVKRSAN